MGVWKSLWWREKSGAPWFRPRKAQPLKLEAKASKVADDALKSPSTFKGTFAGNNHSEW